VIIAEMISPATIEIDGHHVGKKQGHVKPRNKWCNIDQYGTTGSSVAHHRKEL
jgi:hypothetical protein